MSSVPTDEFLSHLRSLYPPPAPGEVSPWSCIAAVTFSASNVPEAVPVVFQYALKDTAAHSERLVLARKFRDAIFKSGMLSGYSKAINALIMLHKVIPEDLRDRAPLRDLSTSVRDINRTGQTYFERTYGSTTEPVQNLLRDIYPDLEYFSTTFAYGYTYGFCDVLTPAETSFVMIAALIANDTPLQIEWHLPGAMRNGASEQEVRSTRQLAIEVSKTCGVVWKNAVPDLVSL